MVQLGRLLVIMVTLGIILRPSEGWSFDYGQCLVDRSGSFNQELREYRNVALAKAAIKKLSLEADSDLLKWNYETTRFIYDLIIIQPTLIHLQKVYQTIQTNKPEAINIIQSFLSGTSGHLALAQVDDSAGTEDQDSLDEFLGQIEDQMPLTQDGEKQIDDLRNSIALDPVRDALGDIYDRIQEASVGATPIEPSSINQWIELGTFFKNSLVLPNCTKCAKAESAFRKVINQWIHASAFLSEEDFEKELRPNLPPLFKIKYPQLAETSTDAQRVIQFHYIRTMEDFLFGRSEIPLKDVRRWMLTGSNYKIVLRQAQREPEFEVEAELAVKLQKYLSTQMRVLNNAFDHFVWNGQDGSEREKSIDGVARTIYGEAESCQIAGAHQFEAIGAIIAARSISVDLENQSKNLFITILDYALTGLSKLSPVEIAPLSSYRRGASDFGRLNELRSHPIVAKMTTPAQVVSRPNQFSVWKIGRSQNLEVSRWIKFPAKSGYPQDLSVSVLGPAGEALDPAQLKVLCPNNEIFKKAVEVATEVVDNYYEYANKYRFYQKSQRVVPYFYTHGPKTRLGFVKRILPTPNFVKLQSVPNDIRDHKFELLPMMVGDINCRTFKLYRPLYFDVWSKKKNTKSKKKSGRRRN